MTTQAALESLLFVAGEEGLSLQELTTLLSIGVVEAQNLVTRLQEKYVNDADCALQLVVFANRYQLVTKGAYAEVIKQYAVSPFASRLSQAALETLAIIAYRQPLTRGAIDGIRGVQSTGALQKLLLRNLIEEKGREETPGRPILYGTTDYFMNYFGLENLTQLPDMAQFEVASEDELKDLFAARYEQIEALATRQKEGATASQQRTEEDEA